MKQISFFDKDYLSIIHKSVQAVKQSFINVVAKVQDAVKMARGWKFQEVRMEIIKS